MTGNKMNRFDEICLELNEFDKKTGFTHHYESQFRTIARLSQTEEGCFLSQAKNAVATWWDNAKSILTDKDISMMCLAAFPLHALRVSYDNAVKKQKFEARKITDIEGEHDHP